MSDLNSSGLRPIYEPHFVFVEDRLRRIREAKSAPPPAVVPMEKLIPLGAIALAGVLVFMALAQLSDSEPGTSIEEPEAVARRMESLENQLNADGRWLVENPRDVARWKKFRSVAQELGYSEDVAMADEMLAKLE